MNERLRQQEDLVDLTRQDNQKERATVGEKLTIIHKLEEEIRGRDEALDAARMQYTELEAKLRTVETRS